MYKMMIVDDERLIREGLSKLNWKQYGIEIRAVCKNGLEAVEKIKEDIPDIIMFDICMPIMDGLELATYINKNHPDINMVVLSGYSDFTYAKECIKLGVFDYILKPIDSDQLSSAFRRVVKHLAEEKDKIRQNDISEEIIKETIAEKLVQGKDVYGAELDIFKTLVEGDSIRVAAFVQDTMTAKNTSNMKRVGKSFREVFSKYIKDTDAGYYYVQIKEGRVMGYLILTKDAANSNKEQLKEELLALKEKLYKENLPVKFTGSWVVSDIFKGMYNIHSTVKRIEEYYHVAFLSNTIEFICTEKSGAVTADSRSNYEKTNIIRDEKGKPNNIKQNVLDEVFEYIYCHYDKPINLASVANEVHLNSSYLSELFKKNTGINFIDYLTNYRIQKALVLLKNSDLKINEISQMVGIEPKYFGSVFKKCMGITAMEYRRKGQEPGEI